MADLPSGTVTFLYTDIEGSTARWERHPAAMRAAVARHDALIRPAVAAHDGHVFRTAGDGLCAAFATAPAALAAALDAQRAFVAEAWGELGPLRVRMALHTGAAEVRDGDDVGAALNRIARLLAAGHGGQVLLSQTAADLARGGLPDRADLRDLGEHRLRDLVRPERVYQLIEPDLPAAFPALRSLDAYRHNLPLQLTSFVGRERERADVRDQLVTHRLVTLTGTGGCGKTRLALQVAADLVDAYPDGVWLVELAALTDPGLVPQAIALAVGMREAVGQSLLTTLLAAFTARTVLLVLVNCEHLLDACAHVADALLRGCPGLQVLATSREALGIAGEVRWRVPSLPVPPPDRRAAGGAEALVALGRYDAVRLFIERGATSRPGFTMTDQNAAAVAHLCQRLDGIPLALELAAARVSGLAVEQIAARLDQRFRLLTGGSRTALPRQQTLAAAVEWSYHLLAEPERALFDRLAVFSGRFTLETAEAVCAGDGIAAEDVLDLLLRLVDKSLVVAEEGADGREGYRLLETLRQYGRERLRASGQAETAQARHATHYLALAEQAVLEMDGPRLAAWLARLEAELADLRAALRWAVAAGDAERGLRLSGQLVMFWYHRGYPADGRAGLADLLALPAARARTGGRGWALLGLAWLAHHLGDLAAARSWSDEARVLQREAGDGAGLAMTLIVLGRVALEEGDAGAARATLEEAVTRARASGDRYVSALTLHFLGTVVYTQGEYGRSRVVLEECLTLTRAAGNPQFIGSTLTWLGHVVTAQGDYAAARALYAESLAFRQEVGIRFGLALTLSGFANLAAAQGRPARALRLAGAAARECEETAVPIARLRQGGIGRRLDTCREELGAAAADAAWEAGRVLTLEQAVAEALANEPDG